MVCFQYFYVFAGGAALAPTDSSCAAPSTIYDSFKPPIEYVAPEALYDIPKSLLGDLELVETTDSPDASGARAPAAHYLVEPAAAGKFAIETVPQYWGRYYTTDTDFLRESQDIIKNIAARDICFTHNLPPVAEISAVWRELKEDISFMEKYNYMDWEPLMFLNENPFFMEILMISSILSPALVLFMPILTLIVPFFILNATGIQLSFKEYVRQLYLIFQQSMVGKTFSKFFTDMSPSNFAYCVLSVGLYVMQTYQNAVACVRSIKNLQHIRERIKFLELYARGSAAQIDSLAILARDSGPVYKVFCAEAAERSQQLKTFADECHAAGGTNLGSIGSAMVLFYKLHSHKEIEQLLKYTFGFQAYCAHLESIKNNLSAGHIAAAEFTGGGAASMSGMIYPVLKDGAPVRNDVDITAESIILTGPNASGKTTVLKAFMLNTLITQQCGFGFYRTYKIEPFTNFHSYVNIPDTSARESLFQAEAKRCKQILDELAGGGRHLCIFDELFSGTNPSESVWFAKRFIKYISPKCRFLLTTHFRKICKDLSAAAGEKENMITFMKMSVTKDGKYTYRIRRGISRVNGAHRVLHDMGFPADIV